MENRVELKNICHQRSLCSTQKIVMAYNDIYTCSKFWPKLRRGQLRG